MNFFSTFYTFPFHEHFFYMFCTIVKGEKCEYLLLQMLAHLCFGDILVIHTIL
jgi:hypothetical protein